MKTPKLSHIIANLDKPQKEGDRSSKYLPLVEQALSMFEQGADAKAASAHFRETFSKVHKLEPKGRSQDPKYRLFNALVSRTLKIATRGRKWFNENQNVGFYRMSDLDAAPPKAKAKPAAKPAAAKKAKAKK